VEKITKHQLINHMEKVHSKKLTKRKEKEKDND